MSKPIRLGIITAGLGRMPVLAFEYLVLKLNTLQDDIEYVLIPIDEPHPFMDLLKNKRKSIFSVFNKKWGGIIIPYSKFKIKAPTFVNWLNSYIEHRCKTYSLKSTVPDGYLFISLNSLDNEYYYEYNEKYSAIFLGEWENKMAPPSLLEFLITLVITEGITAMISDSPMELIHYDTRGCIGDFNPLITDARYQVLQGFLCSDCREALVKKLGEERTNRWISILSKNWLGRTSDQDSPASIVAKLGYDLFQTKGVAPDFWQKIKKALSEEGIKEVIRITSAIVLAALLLWLNLKQK